MKRIIYGVIAMVILAGCTTPAITNVNMGDQRGSKVKVYSSSQEIEITS